jgi:hypothetical protein
MTDISMWQILVPAFWRDGEEIDVSTHRTWDRKVRTITGGLTINRSAKGHWVSPDGDVVVEKVIPVNFSATEEQKNKIMAMTCLFYDQDAVMCYKIGTDVIVMSREEARNLSCSATSVKDQEA